MSLSVSARPVKADVLNIATALANVLNLPAGELSGLDARAACEWMKEKVPGLNNELAISSNSKHQREICQKLSLLLPESEQQREACSGLADLMCVLASATKSGLKTSMSELDAMIGACKDDECRDRLGKCAARCRDAVSLLEKQESEVRKCASESAGISGKNAREWSDKMTCALSGAPIIAEMIILVCDCCCEIEALCAECAANAATASVSGGNCGCEEQLDLFKGGWVHGGSAVGGLTIDLDTKKQTEARRKAMTTFINEAKDLFDQVLNAVYALGQRMGKGTVALDDDFLRFKNAFNDLESVYRPGIEYVLTGYFVHARAAEHRERFLGKLQAVVSTLTPLSAGPNGDLFKKIKEPLEALQRHCDKYSDQFHQSSAGLIQTKFGKINEEPTWGGVDFSGAAQRARDALHAAPKVIRETAQDVREVKGALMDAARGGDDMDIVSGGVLSKAGLTLQNVRRSLEHFFRVAKMRDNLKVASSESKEYNANYSKVLGEPLAEMIDKENDAYNKFKANLTTQMSGEPDLRTSPHETLVYNTIKRAVESGSTGGDNIARDWNLEAITTMASSGRDARIELYKVAQAIDLALMNFTDATASNPDEIKSISKMLDSTEIIADMFTESSGDHIAALFEYMPGSIEPSKNAANQADGKSIETKYSPLSEGATSIIDVRGARLKLKPNQTYAEVATNAAKAGNKLGNPFLMISPARAEYARKFAKTTLERLQSLKNIVAAFCFMGSKSRASASGGAEHWESGDIFGALVKYMYVSAFAMGWDGYDMNAAGSNAMRKQFGKKYADAFPNLTNPTLQGDVPDIGVMHDLGANLGIPGTGIYPDPVQFPGAARIQTADWKDFCDGITRAPGQDKGWLIAFNVDAADKGITTVPPFARIMFGCGMNSVPLPKDTVDPIKTVGGWSCQFKKTDEMFIRAIKAMVAKVVTVTGMYNVLNFSSPDDHTLSATRFILGGAENPASSIELANLPPVYEDAVELYLRLPLLVEFYRDIFSLTGKKIDDGKSQLIVALAPEMDLTWSGIMRLSFDNANGSNVVTKNYASQMIIEINRIYEKYKNRGASLVTSAINDFVLDVNRRYGLMSRVESTKYKEMMQANRRAYAESSEADILTDFDTIGLREAAGRRAAALPSDQFTKSQTGSTASDASQSFLKQSFVDSIVKFREQIDDKIRDATHAADKFTPAELKSDFHDQARITKNELKHTTDPEKRFNIVFATMSGIDSISKIDESGHVMFHESILAPLAVLEVVHDQLNRFMTDIDSVWITLNGGAPNYVGAFRTLTSALMIHVSSGSSMVDMGVESKKVVLDHSKLQSFAEELLSDVSKMLQRFRNVVPKELIENCESRIQVLNSELVEVIFHNEIGDDVQTIERTSRRVTEMYTKIATAPRILYGPTVKSLVYYDPAVAGFNSVPSVLTQNDKLGKLFMKKVEGKDVYIHTDLMFAARREIYLSRGTFRPAGTPYMGLMMRFNELLAMYLNQFWDKTNAKIYMPLIMGIASANSNAVYNGMGWPDLVQAAGFSLLPIDKLAPVAFAASRQIAPPGPQGPVPVVPRRPGPPLPPLIPGPPPPPPISGGDDVSGGFPWTPNWANLLREEFKSGHLHADFDVPTLANIPPGGDALVQRALDDFIARLNTTSTSITPVQLINLLKHAFESVVTTATLPADLRKLAEVRDTIVSIVGSNWIAYGPISAIAAVTFINNGGIQGGAGGGANIKALLEANGYKAPEVTPSNEMSGFSSPPPAPNSAFGNPDEIMFASLGKIIKTMLTTQEKTIPLYVVSSLSDSSPMTVGIKENIRANLPIFVKMFDMIRKDCEIIGNLLTIGINVTDNNGHFGYMAELLDVHGKLYYTDEVRPGVPFTGVNALNYMSRLLNKIAQSCGAIIDSADDVMREVFDDPKYLEVKENSISKYRTDHNVDPFMPLSTILTPLNRAIHPNELTFPLPESREFEFNYGTRLLLNKPKVSPKLDQMNGVREIVESYNLIAAGDKTISLDSAFKSSLYFIQLTRWLVDLAWYVPVTSNVPTAIVVPGSIFQLDPTTTLDTALNLTTGANKRRSIAQLSDWVTRLAGGPGLNRNPALSRERMQIMNIIDMNVNPINLNALRREVPLINMLNYSITFDAFVKEQLKKSAPNIAVAAAGRASHVADMDSMLLQLALNPYYQKTDADDWKYIFECFSDTSAGRLGFTGHDAFALDQVFRKSLFYSGDNRNQGGIDPLVGIFGRKTGMRPRLNLKAYATPGRDQVVLNQLNVLGMARHDTTFIRNILFISMCHRMLRARMNKEMTRITFPVVSGPPAVSSEIADEDMWADRSMTRESWGQTF